MSLNSIEVLPILNICTTINDNCTDDSGVMTCLLQVPGTMKISTQCL